MGLTSSYLLALSRLPDLLKAVQTAEAPDRFTQKFLEDLGFKSTNDRLFIGVLQGLGFLDSNRVPTERYFRYLDEEVAPAVLAEGIRDAYEDLFRVNKKAYNLSTTAVKGKLKSLTQGRYSDTVIGNMAKTFTGLVKLADFESEQPAAGPTEARDETNDINDSVVENDEPVVPVHGRLPANHTFTYRIEIVLPNTRDKAVYDSIFRSMREHLL